MFLLPQTHGIIFVLDASNQDRMDEAKEVLLNTLKDERMRGKPLLLLANKQDQGAFDPDQIIDKLALQEVLSEVRGDMRLPPTRVVST